MSPGTGIVVEGYAVGFARPDRWVQPGGSADRPWHAVEAHRPPEELDGEVELAVCGAIVQVWGWQRWDRLAAGHTACVRCLGLIGGDPLGKPAATPSPATAPAPAKPRESGPRLRIVS